MKVFFSIVFTLFLGITFAQGLKLKECVIVGQFDKLEDRYAMEVNLCEILNNFKIQTIPATNIIKQGGNAVILNSDSIQNVLKDKKFQTYCIVSVKGYDKNFRKSQNEISLKDALERASIYQIYKDEITSVTFEFLFYRDGKFIHGDILKIGNIGDRDAVIKRLRKKLPKHVSENWLN